MLKPKKLMTSQRNHKTQMKDFLEIFITKERITNMYKYINISIVEVDDNNNSKAQRIFHKPNSPCKRFNKGSETSTSKQGSFSYKHCRFHLFIRNVS